MAETPAQGHDASVAATPQIKRYALVPNGSNNGVRRFQLARVASHGRVPDAQRLERMDEIAAREREKAEGWRKSCP